MRDWYNVTNEMGIYVYIDNVGFDFYVDMDMNTVMELVDIVNTNVYMEYHASSPPNVLP
jgi:hypothetical protein